MKRLTMTLLAGLLSTAAISASAYADDYDDALSLMALNTSSANIATLTSEVRSLSTGVVIEVEVDDHKKSSFVYEFKVVDLQEGVKHELKYALEDGLLLKHEEKSLTRLGFSKLDSEDKTAIEAVENANFDILKALVALEQKYSAKVIEAELETKKGIVFYEVELANAEQGKIKLLINVANGEEIPVMKRSKHK
jgi:hypothetical protein